MLLPKHCSLAIGILRKVVYHVDWPFNWSIYLTLSNDQLLFLTVHTGRKVMFINNHRILLLTAIANLTDW